MKIPLHWRGLSKEVLRKYDLWRIRRGCPPGPLPVRAILFSEHPLWEPSIREGLQPWPVEVTFAPLSSADLARFDLVVPLSAPESVWLAKQSWFRLRNAIATADAEVVEICDDKQRFDERLIALGLGQYVPAWPGRDTFPYVLKKRRGSGSNEVHILHGPADERRLGALLDDPGYMRQALIPGRDEYVTHFHYSQERVVSELTFRYRYPRPDAIKFQDRAESIRLVRCPAQPLLGEILKALGYEGLCCFNYKIENGLVRIIELNPRFGGSLRRYFFRFLADLPVARRAAACSAASNAAANAGIQSG